MDFSSTEATIRNLPIFRVGERGYRVIFVTIYNDNFDKAPPGMTRSRRWFYILFPLVCFFVFAYPVYRLSNWYGDGMGIGASQTVLLWLLATVAMWYSFSGPKMLVRYITVHWMGVSFVLFAVLLGYEVIRLLVPVDDHLAVLWIIGITAVLVILAVVTSHFLGVKHLEFKSEKVTRPHRIVQISDVHIGSRQGAYLERIVNRINRLEPDVVMITGDLVDSSAVGHDELKSLQKLQARTLFSIGNHERYSDLDKILGIVTNLGVEPLRQQYVIAGEIQIIGIDDADHHNQVANQLPLVQHRMDHYTVLMYHRPLGWEAALEHGVDLMLCGHTHNGQIFPFNLVVKRQFNRIRGLYSEGDSHLYVSPGSGTWGPLMRLGSLNEITCFDLKPVD
jgi:predicted MPP superfamily phosphohydrolase